MDLLALLTVSIHHSSFHSHSHSTIGLRLGKVALKPVEWSEINAGLGQAVLLLDTVGSKVSFSFEFLLVPFGSWSRY